MKAKADYHKYICEIGESEEGYSDTLQLAADSYAKAQEFASELATTHPIRLGMSTFEFRDHLLPTLPGRAVNEGGVYAEGIRGEVVRGGREQNQSKGGCTL